MWGHLGKFSISCLYLRCHAMQCNVGFDLFLHTATPWRLCIHDSFKGYLRFLAIFVCGFVQQQLTGRVHVWERLSHISLQRPDLVVCIPYFNCPSLFFFFLLFLFPVPLTRPANDWVIQVNGSRAPCLPNEVVWDGPACPQGLHITWSSLSILLKREDRGLGVWWWVCVVAAAELECNYSSTETSHLLFFSSLTLFFPTFFPSS